MPDKRHGGWLLLDEPGEDVQHGGRLAAPTASIIRLKAPLQERQDNLHRVHNIVKNKNIYFSSSQTALKTANKKIEDKHRDKNKK